MTLKRTFASVVLLLAFTLLAGCSSFLPTLPGQPPVDVEHGTVEFFVDLTQVVDAGIPVDSASARLTSGARVITEELVIDGDAAATKVYGVPTGSWQATVALYDQDVQVASKRHDIIVDKGKITPVFMVASVDGNTVTLEVGSDPGTGNPGTGDPGDGDDDGTGGDPGDDDDDDSDVPGDDDGDDGDEPGDGNGGTDPGDDDDDPQLPTVTREVRYIQSGSRTETRTEVYIIRSSEPGPTVMLVGGVHGSERSGWMVAGEVAREWDIDRGTLVVLPEANKDAVRQLRRTGRDGRDLNRAFPRNRAINRPTDWLLAQRIWDIVLEFQPEALMDLHEGWGLREAGDRFPGGTLSVGQTLIVYPAGDAQQFAKHVVNVLNTEHNPFYGRNGYTYNFQIIGPPADGSLARKAGNDLGIPAFIVEPTQGRAGRHQTTVEQRQRWHRVFVEEFLRWYGLID